MSRRASRAERLRRDPAAQAVALPDGRLLVRHGDGLSVLRGVAVEDLRRVLAEVDGRRTADQIAAALAGEYEPEAVVRLLGSVSGDLVHPARRPPRPGGTGPRVGSLALLASGRTGGKLAARLRRAGLADVRLLAVASLAARDPADEDLAALGPAEPSADAADPALPDGTLAGVTRADLLERLGGVALAVCVLEGTPYRALFEVQAAALAAGIPILFLTADPDGLRLGPAVLPGAGPCLGCAQLAGLAGLGLAPADLLAALGGFRTGPLSGAGAEAAQKALVGEALALLGAGGEPTVVGEILLVAASGRTRRLPVERNAACPLCGDSAAGHGFHSERDGGSGPEPSPAGAAARRGERALAEVLDRRPARAVPAADGQVTTVGILGGGTAGYLAALALRARLPHLAVSLIESPHLPVIGVGEATTPLMPQFLHVDLGLGVQELFREVRPTFKLGIRFLWGQPGVGDFHYPFGPLHPVEPRVYGEDGGTADGSLQGMLMSAGAAPIYGGEGDWACRLGTEVAYHLDNERFVAYLKRRAEERGVERLEATIAQVERSEDGEEVRALLADDGRRLAYDLYLDCTGFRALLLEGALGSPWQSFAASLPADRAVVGAVPHGGSVRPYTTAETYRCGWCWSTPQADADHRGYVYSSAWLDEAGAEAEMRQGNPGMGPARVVRFRAGRHAHFWKGNVVALGNAYGFVEPLESTALHMLIRQIGLLVRSFPVRRGERGLQALLDRKVGAWWDYLRWFLALHYRFNRRLDTPFWRAANEGADLSSHAELLAAFRERGPLSYDPAARAAFDYPDPLWGPEGIDALLLGQGVPAPLPRPALDLAAWGERQRLARALVARALPHARALDLLAERPDLLETLAAAFREAGPAFPVARA